MQDKIKIKITEKNWENYNGYLGTILFEDGIGEADAITASRLGSQIQIVNLEDDSFVNAYALPCYREIPVETTVFEKGVEGVAEEIPLEPIVEEISEPVHIYTLEELQEVADAQGIQGLRDIATPLDVKGVSINALIDGILQAQK